LRLFTSIFRGWPIQRHLNQQRNYFKLTNKECNSRNMYICLNNPKLTVCISYDETISWCYTTHEPAELKMHEKLNYQEHSWKVKTNTWVNLNQFPLFEWTTIHYVKVIDWHCLRLCLHCFLFHGRFGVDSLESSSSHVTFPLPTILPSQPFSHPFIKVTIHVTTPIFLVILWVSASEFKSDEDMNIKLYKLI
jgi:hypothetical protein